MADVIGKITINDNGELEIERGATEQGYVYKNFKAYEDKTDEICYIPELSDTTYNWQYFQDEFDELADEVFYTIDWQSPYSYYDELHQYEDND